MTLRDLAFVSALLLALPASVAAQQPQQDDSSADGSGGTYVKLGLTHWQGNIFSRQSLTRWNGNLFGSEYNLTSAEVEIETYFDHPGLLSGWSIGYRKDALRYIDSGHMLHAGVFRTVNLALFALRAGGGAEWGVPSLNFDTTEFDFREDGAIRYTHTYPIRNANIPFVGTRKDGAVYPFVELSIVQRPGALLLEGGVRANIVGFQFDDYEVDVTDRITHGFSEKKVLVPYLFVNVGLRLF